MRLLKNKISLIASCMLILSGCTLTNNARLPAAQASPPAALAFSADSSLRNRLSGATQTLLSNAEAQALNFGQPGVGVEWKGRRADVSGTVTAYQPFRVGSSNCRRFVHQIKDGSKGYEASGTACRGRENAWKLVN